MQQVLLYNAHLGLIKVPPQKTLDSISLVTPYMKFDSSGIKVTETAPVQHVSPTNDKHFEDEEYLNHIPGRYCIFQETWRRIQQEDFYLLYPKERTI